MAYYWTAFNWDDYDRKTQHLPLLKHGAYVQLLKHYYRTRGPLEANVKQLLFICRANTPEEIEAVEAVLSEFFVLRDGYYHNERCDEEIARANEISEKRALAGAKGGSNKRQAIAKQMPVQLHTQLQPFVLPVWVPEKPWNDYQQTRIKLRKPMTERAKELAIKELEKLMNQGHDPEAVLNQSVMRGYLGLFAVEGSLGKNKPVRPQRISAAEARAESNDAALVNVLRKRHGDIAVGAVGSSAEQGNATGGGLHPVAGGPVVLPPIRN